MIVWNKSFRTYNVKYLYIVEYIIEHAHNKCTFKIKPKKNIISRSTRKLKIIIPNWSNCNILWEIVSIYLLRFLFQIFISFFTLPSPMVPIQSEQKRTPCIQTVVRVWVIVERTPRENSMYYVGPRHCWLNTSVCISTFLLDKSRTVYARLQEAGSVGQRERSVTCQVAT